MQTGSDFSEESLITLHEPYKKISTRPCRPNENICGNLRAFNLSTLKNRKRCSSDKLKVKNMIRIDNKYFLVSISLLFAFFVVTNPAFAAALTGDTAASTTSPTEDTGSTTPQKENDSLIATTSEAIVSDPSQTASSTPNAAPNTASTTESYVKCPSAYTSDLYNTPDGHFAPGARIIGVQSWASCVDDQGNKYEYKLASDEYKRLGRPGEYMPRKPLLTSARVDYKHSSPSSTPNGQSKENTPENASVENPVIDSATTTIQDSSTSTPKASLPEILDPEIASSTISTSTATETPEVAQ